MELSKLKQHLINYILPPRLADYLWLASTYPGYLKNISLLDRNSHFKNIHCDEVGFIVCNGPSVNSQNLRALKGKTVISVSNGYLHPDFQIYSPRYHCTPQLSIGPVTSMAHVSEDIAVQWLREMHANVGDAEIFHSVQDASFIHRNKLYPGRRVNYLYMAGPLFGNARQPIDLTRILPSVTTVPIMALMIALYMGFREIYLLGVDHDSYKSRIYNHFYDPSLQYGGRANKATGVVDTPVTEELLIYYKVFMQYRALLSIAQNRGVGIYNATRGGALEELPRAELDVVLNRLAEQS